MNNQSERLKQNKNRSRNPVPGIGDEEKHDC